MKTKSCSPQTLAIIPLVLLILAFSGCGEVTGLPPDYINFYRKVYPVNDWDELKEKAEDSQGPGLIGLTKSFSTPASGISIRVRRKLVITNFKGETAIIRQAGFTDPIFKVAGGRLTLGYPGRGQVTLDGNGQNGSVLAVSPGGELVMESGIITRGRNTGDGGGVRLDGSAVFTMNGGTITGNTAANGGGVYSEPGAVFTMNGGTITGNSATGNGGGVYRGTIFTRNGGTVSGNLPYDVFPEHYGDGSSASSPIEVYTVPDLAAVGTDTASLAKHYKLMNDLTLLNWTAIGNNTDKFTGGFDGNGKTLTFSGNLTPNNGYAGVFGNTDTSSIVKNLKVAGTINVNAAGTLYVGGIAGGKRGQIKYCAVTADINVTGGDLSVGGIAGINGGSFIRNCYVVGDINASGTGNVYAGGISGDGAAADVQYCFTTGTVSGAAGAGNTSKVCGIVTNALSTNGIDHNAVLGFAISATGGSINTADRISPDSTNCYANYANSAMTLNGVPVSESSPDGTTHGADVTLAAMQVQSWWSATLGFSFGTDETAPWKWNAPFLRPVLWFE